LTVILAESSDDMQNQINYWYDFCKKWRLKENIEKFKVLFFSNGCLPNNIKFNYNDKELKIVAHFSYLGIVFSKTGSFNPCISLHQYEIILTLISISSGYLPNFPYTIKLGVDTFRRNKSLQKNVVYMDCKIVYLKNG
jgi:hypothetical protein